MNLDIAGRTALVCAASKGLGKACATALALEGVKVTIVARNPLALQAAVADIEAHTGQKVTAVAADIATDTGRAEALCSCPEPDILITNAGGPPHGDFRQWNREHWQAALDANMLAPIELIKATIDGMIAREFGRIVNITSSTVKMPLDTLCLSNGARAGLTAVAAGMARRTVRYNVTVNNLLPGPFDTDRLQATLSAAAQALGRDVDELRADWMNANPAGRFGDPAEFGAMCAFLCGAQAGFITGQNITIDGGAYPGLI